jgi:hypothetical protein
MEVEIYHTITDENTLQGIMRGDSTLDPQDGAIFRILFGMDDDNDRTLVRGTFGLLVQDENLQVELRKVLLCIKDLKDQEKASNPQMDEQKHETKSSVDEEAAKH